MIKVRSIDIHASVAQGKIVEVGPALVDQYEIITVRPIVSLTEQDGSNDLVDLPGSLLSFKGTSNDRAMYVAETPEEIFEIIDAEALRWSNMFATITSCDCETPQADGE